MASISTRRLLLSLLFIAALSSAQTELWRLTSTTLTSPWGNSIATGDVTGDGLGDFAIVVFGMPPEIQVFSGATYSSVVSLPSMFGGVDSGYQPIRAGDFDLDGRADLIARSINQTIVYSSATWAPIHVISNSSLGQACMDIGDVTGDGIPDLAFSGLPTTVPNGGVVSINSGADLTPVYALYGMTAFGNFGSWRTVLGDIDDDGISDFAVGAPGQVSFPTGPGEVFIISGATGTTLHHLFGPGTWSLYGSRISDVEDVDGDGRKDLSIYAPGAIGLGQPNALGGYGQVTIVSSLTGATLATFDCAPNPNGTGGSSGQCGVQPGTSSFASQQFANVGDVDGDGRGDLLVVGIANTPGGANQVLSGIDLHLAYGMGHSSNPADAWGISGILGDLTGDGVTELFVRNGGNTLAGLYPWIGVYSMAPQGLDIFGPACTGGCEPRMVALGRPEAGDTVTITLADVPVGSFGLLIVGISNTTWGTLSLPHSLGAIGLLNCNLLVSPDTTVPIFAEAFGNTSSHASIVTTIPSQPSLTGLQAYCQWIVALPPGLGESYAMSRGLAVTFF